MCYYQLEHAVHVYSLRSAKKTFRLQNIQLKNGNMCLFSKNSEEKKNLQATLHKGKMELLVWNQTEGVFDINCF